MKTKTQHTPAPWINSGTSFIDVGNGDGMTPWLEICTAYRPVGCDFSTPAYAVDEATADHIVKCVNAHDELVDALSALLHDQTYPPEVVAGECSLAISKARAVLARLEGGAK